MAAAMSGNPAVTLSPSEMQRPRLQVDVLKYKEVVLNNGRVFT